MITDTFPAGEDGQEIRFHHNGDFSGDVHVVLPASALMDPFGAGDTHIRVSIPFEALKFIVAAYRHGKMQAWLDDAGTEELLDRLVV